MKKMSGYPRWFPWLLTITLTALLVSGGLLLPTMLDMRLGWDVTWRLTGGQRVGVAALHVGMGFLMLAALGALATIHMRMGWRRRKNRITGTLLTGLITGLALSGLGIFYFGEESLSLGASVIHTLMGGSLVILFSDHARAGYRLRSAAKRSRPIHHRQAGALAGNELAQ